MTKARAVFLDRDGVINRAIVREGKPFPPSSLAELEILPGTDAALQDLKRLGFLLIVATNQPDVAKGKQTKKAVEEMHAALQAALPIDEIVVCYHEDRDGCSCRKPLPGMLLDAARRRHIDLDTSFLIGDRWRDIDAGHAARCRTVLLDYGYQERPPAFPPERRVHTLLEAVEWIKSQTARKHPPEMSG